MLKFLSLCLVLISCNCYSEPITFNFKSDQNIHITPVNVDMVSGSIVSSHLVESNPTTQRAGVLMTFDIDHLSHFNMIVIPSVYSGYGPWQDNFVGMQYKTQLERK